MNLCAIICEYNPFHNGHRHLIEEAKRISGCDGIICFMSGSFTQRGDITVMDKFTRAVHAVKGGADCIIQLPVSFSVAPAEIFAAGAIKLITSVPDIKYLAFGCENDNKNIIRQNAEILVNESEQFKINLRKNLEHGESYARSYQMALSVCGGNSELLNGSNNILAIEYTKSLINAKSNIEILPVKRIGSSYNEERIKKEYSSAAAIRENITSHKIKKNVPDYVYTDIQKTEDIKEFAKTFGDFLHFSIIKNSSQSMKDIFGCSEGLENKLKKEAKVCSNADEIISAVTNKRYPSSRIKRIMCANLLELYEKDCRRYLSSPLYLKPLAIKLERSDEILSALSHSVYPMVIRKNNTANLCNTAIECLDKDDFADETRAIICGEQIYNYTLKTV